MNTIWIYFALEFGRSKTMKLKRKVMNRLFEFGLKNIDGFAVFQKLWYKQVIREHLRKAIIFDSMIVDQKPGRRNVRFEMYVIFSKMCNYCRILKLPITVNK